MYTSYSIEKIATSYRRDALAAAEERRLARALRRTAPTEQQESPAAGPIRIPRRRGWMQHVVRRTAVTGR